jgi:PAS domain S-box-containing protein
MNQQSGRLWLRYKTLIKVNLFGDNQTQKKDILYWKNKVFCNLLVYMLPVSILSLIPSVFMTFKNGIPLLGICDLITFSTVLFIAVIPGIPVLVRKAVFIASLYFLALALFIFLGSFGPGMMFLLALTVISSVILPSSVGYLSILINAFICIGMALFIQLQPAGSQLATEYSIGTWIAESSNVLLFSVVCAACMNLLIKGFEKNIQEVSIAEQRIIASEMELSSFFNNVNEMLFSVDVIHQRMIQMSPACEKIYGYSQEEFMTDPNLWQNAIHPEDKELVAGIDEQLMRQKVVINQYRIIHKDGSTRWTEHKLTPTYSEDGQLLRIDGVVMDITDRKLIEEEMQEKKNELEKLSAYLQNVREEERKYIAREVHDELGQLASALKIDVDWLGLKMGALDETGQKRIAHANNTIEVLISSIRKIASRLRPSILDDFGLNAALQWYCNEFQSQTGVICIFEHGFDDRNLAMEIKTELFRMTQESLTNIMRHAEATQVKVSTASDNKKLYLTVTDNGKGFDTRKRKNTLGLVGLRERAGSLNGELQIDSEMGKGTTIRAIIPKK